MLKGPLPLTDASVYYILKAQFLEILCAEIVYLGPCI